MATHSSILAWRIPWTEEPAGLQFTGLHRVGRDWSDLTWLRNKGNTRLSSSTGRQCNELHSEASPLVILHEEVVPRACTVLSSDTHPPRLRNGTSAACPQPFLRYKHGLHPLCFQLTAQIIIFPTANLVHTSHPNLSKIHSQKASILRPKAQRKNIGLAKSFVQAFPYHLMLSQYVEFIIPPSQKHDHCEQTALRWQLRSTIHCHQCDPLSGPGFARGWAPKQSSFIQQTLMSAGYVSGTILGSGVTALNNTEILAPSFWWVETDEK